MPEQPGISTKNVKKTTQPKRSQQQTPSRKNNQKTQKTPIEYWNIIVHRAYNKYLLWYTDNWMFKKTQTTQKHENSETKYTQSGEEEKIPSGENRLEYSLISAYIHKI